MPVTDMVQLEVEQLIEDGLDVEVVKASDAICLVIRRFALPVGYNMEDTDLLLKLPLSYPNGKPDMFWADEGLLLTGGGVPQNADHIEVNLDQRWRRFSWHPQSWNPGVDSLRTYVEFVRMGLSKARKK